MTQRNRSQTQATNDSARVLRTEENRSADEVSKRYTAAEVHEVMRVRESRHDKCSCFAVGMTSEVGDSDPFAGTRIHSVSPALATLFILRIPRLVRWLEAEGGALLILWVIA